MSAFSSFLKRLFGGGPSSSPQAEKSGESEPPEQPIEHYREAWLALSQPSWRFKGASGTGRSRLGGEGAVPGGAEWPTRDGRKLRFLLQLDLADLHERVGVPSLPSSGTLAFFYDDSEFGPWGFDPKDRPGWRVLYSAERPVVLESGEPIKFVPFASCPSWERPQVERLEIPDDFNDKLIDELDGEEPRHQLFGFPNPVQNDSMEEECQFASNGLSVGTGRQSGTEDGKRLVPGVADWILLAQIDSDDDVDFMWGDAGMLYFFIRKQDLAASRFDDVWMVLQCC